jgi:hypothetical protein
MSSKTARSSAVKEVVGPKKVIPDTELLRLLRIDLAAGIYPGVQHAAAVVRLYDESQARLKQYEETAKAEVPA